MAVNNPRGPAASDAGPRWLAKHGVTSLPVTSANATAGVDVTEAPGATQLVTVTDFIFSTDTAMNVVFKEETSGTVIAGPFYVPANFSGQLTPRTIAHQTAVAGKKIQAFASVAGNVMFDLCYFFEG